MTKSNIIFAALLLVAAIFLLCDWAASTTEPFIQGRRLSDWLLIAAGKDKRTIRTMADLYEAQSAIRMSGTNAVPFLLSLIVKRPTVFNRAIVEIDKRQSLYHFPVFMEDYRSMAITGFSLLGTNAAPAKQSLGILMTNRDMLIHQTARECFSYIVPRDD